MSAQMPKKILIAGGGPAGLTAAFACCRRHAVPIVFEREGIVGGNARTEVFRDFRFDIGGHRFFTKSAEVSRIWEEMLLERFLHVHRLSRIYYNGRFFHYPLKLGNVVRGLGLWNSSLIVMSFLRTLLSSYLEENNLEEWVSNRFGRRLYKTFFKTYTEKVWGMPCTSIRAEWAAQRIKGLSLRTAVLNAVAGNRKRGIKTLIEEFRYPEQGPGMMWEYFRDHVERNGGQVHLNHDVTGVRHEAGLVRSFAVKGPEGVEREIEGDDFLASMPVSEMIAKIRPLSPPEVLAAAVGLRYRDFLTVCLIVD